MNLSVVIVLLLLGAWGGYYVGRFRAEVGNMFHEFGRIKRRRKAYRERR